MDSYITTYINGVAEYLIPQVQLFTDNIDAYIIPVSSGVLEFEAFPFPALNSIMDAYLFTQAIDVLAFMIDDDALIYTVTEGGYMLDNGVNNLIVRRKYE